MNLLFFLQGFVNQTFSTPIHAPLKILMVRDIDASVDGDIDMHI